MLPSINLFMVFRILIIIGISILALPVMEICARPDAVWVL